MSELDKIMLQLIEAMYQTGLLPEVDLESTLTETLDKLEETNVEA